MYQLLVGSVLVVQLSWEQPIFAAYLLFCLDKFGGALNEEGNGIGLVLLSPEGVQHPKQLSWHFLPQTM